MKKQLSTFLRFRCPIVAQKFDRKVPTLHNSTTPSLLSSFDHPVRPRQHVRRNRQPNLLGGLEVNDQFELCELLRL
jgi:hypothetical protein